MIENKNFQWLDVYLGSVDLEATALPIEPQQLPQNDWFLL